MTSPQAVPVLIFPAVADLSSAKVRNRIEIFRDHAALAAERGLCSPLNEPEIEGLENAIREYDATLADEFSKWSREDLNHNRTNIADHLGEHVWNRINFDDSWVAPDCELVKSTYKAEAKIAIGDWQFDSIECQKNFKQMLKRLEANSEPGEIYSSWRDFNHHTAIFIGHGIVKNGQLYLYYEYYDTVKRVVEQHEFPVRIYWEKWWQWKCSENTRNHSLTMVLDMCHAGKAIDELICWSQRPENRSANITIIASCSKEELSIGSCFLPAYFNNAIIRAAPRGGGSGGDLEPKADIFHCQTPQYFSTSGWLPSVAWVCRPLYWLYSGEGGTRSIPAKGRVFEIMYTGAYEVLDVKFFLSKVKGKEYQIVAVLKSVATSEIWNQHVHCTIDSKEKVETWDLAFDIDCNQTSRMVDVEEEKKKGHIYVTFFDWAKDSAKGLGIVIENSTVATAISYEDFGRLWRDLGKKYFSNESTSIVKEKKRPPEKEEMNMDFFTEEGEVRKRIFKRKVVEFINNHPNRCVRIRDMTIAVRDWCKKICVRTCRSHYWGMKISVCGMTRARCRRRLTSSSSVTTEPADAATVEDTSHSGTLQELKLPASSQSADTTFYSNSTHSTESHSTVTTLAPTETSTLLSGNRGRGERGSVGVHPDVPR